MILNLIFINFYALFGVIRFDLESVDVVLLFHLVDWSWITDSTNQIIKYKSRLKGNKVPQPR